MTLAIEMLGLVVGVCGYRKMLHGPRRKPRRG